MSIVQVSLYAVGIYVLWRLVRNYILGGPFDNIPSVPVHSRLLGMYVEVYLEYTRIDRAPLRTSAFIDRSPTCLEVP